MSKLNILLPLFLSIFLIGCSSVEDSVPTRTQQDSTGDLLQENLIKQGQFTSVGSYTVNGDVDLFYNTVSDTYSLVLSSFISSNGPDLRVYLSQGASPSHFLNLGDLKSTNGTIRYDFSGSQFDPLFDHILIWCDDFSVTFGRAQLSDPSL